MDSPRLVVAMTGASGAAYGVRLLERLRELEVESHLIVTRWARVTLEHETEHSYSDLKSLADFTYGEGDQAAPVSSGSFLTRGMAIVPCSTKTLAAIATGFGHNLVCRAADVMLKERRRLVLAVRETPLSQIHLRNMLTLSEAGATIMPPVPAFYHQPVEIADIVDQTVLRILDQFDFELEAASRWGGFRELAREDLDLIRCRPRSLRERSATSRSRGRHGRSVEFYEAVFGWNIRRRDAGGCIGRHLGEVSGAWVQGARPPRSRVCFFTSWSKRGSIR